MKDRKLHVIACAHKLFIEKGFQATSIQDILDESGIAKGTLYNYFSSKNELLIELFKTLYQKMEKERDELLLGENPADIDIFMRQFELQMETNRDNKLISLFEEVIFINDPELKEFIRFSQLRMLSWVHQRFVEIFGQDKRDYLWDCAIMFLGILNHNIKYYTMTHDKKLDIHRVVQFSVNRLVNMVEDVSKTKEVLLEADVMDRLFPGEHPTNKETICHIIHRIKQSIQAHPEAHKLTELLSFLHDELAPTNTNEPRWFLLESTLHSLSKFDLICQLEDWDKLKDAVKQKEATTT
ncbi:HTH-type transcriptional repressor KstR2 [Bacillus sp. THAF10]|uniref:TetR/AcrR family transcriptional regulator n=1 Tax=Bacillus sp. THAF10 TaxID=2587848 RepID=UPI0012693FB9|nr:TetR/AcrR family transcriptional regulator [Bacillus sp. THAF10]QFT87778.1 HTH-type transcriptional repressor KstR2 [Bacillus sp. THAF10]